MRDDFSNNVKQQLAKRVGYRCSRPDCQQATSGPSLSTPEAVNMGVAAHITAASPGGARYDPSLTPQQRKSYDNGIWLCKYCGDLVDKDEATYPVDILRAWKAAAEERAGVELHRLPHGVQDGDSPSEQQQNGLQNLPQMLEKDSYKAEVENLKNANLRVELSPCLDARSAHEQWSEFPDPDKLNPSSHFYVRHNDTLLGATFSENPDDWCYRIVSLKKDNKDVDAYSDIILKLVGNQDDQKWVFYGHKAYAKLEWLSKDVCTSPPYYQDYRIPVIRPDCTRIGVIRLKRDANLTEHLDKVFKYDLFYRVRGAEVPIRGDEIPVNEMTEAPPTVFISYSYDSPDHEHWVSELARRLRDKRINAILDKWHFKLGKPSAMEMNDAIGKSDRVLCVCTDHYNKLVDEGKGGAGYEGCLITAELIRDSSTDKFIPIIRNVTGTQKTPKCLDGRNRVDLSDGERYEDEFERLLRHLHNAIEIPPLGAHPFLHPSSKMAPPDSFVPPSAAILTMPKQQENGLQDWLTDGRKRWEQLVAKDLSHEQPSRYIHGIWCVAFSLMGNLKPIKLRDLRAVLKQTEEHRVGKHGCPVWAVTIDGFNELDTHPYNDFLECWMGKNPDLDAVYSHFWRASPEGSLFLLRGYQEDCEPNKAPPGTVLWVETPIWDVGEILLHSQRLAEALDDKEASIDISFVWEGLTDRTLSSRSQSHPRLEKTLARAKIACHQPSVSSRFTASIKDISTNLPEIVETITKPLYQRFNFYQPSGDFIQQEISKLKGNGL